MELQKTGKDRFKATISYLNDRGKTENHQFQGTREEIRRDVEKEKDLPPMERSHLLRSLNLTDQNALLPGIRFVPGEGLVIDLDALIPSQPHIKPSPPVSCDDSAGESRTGYKELLLKRIRLGSAGRRKMNARRWKELLAISMIGEGTLATFFPREHLAAVACGS